MYFLSKFTIPLARLKSHKKGEIFEFHSVKIATPHRVQKVQFMGYLELTITFRLNDYYISV